MKKFIYLSAFSLAFAACTSEGLVDEPAAGPNKNKQISFVMSQKNMTRANTTALQATQHYNFGVFAYKSTEVTNNIMDNYLVGYMDETNKKGYKFGANQTTLGDQGGVENGQSMWQYEKLGNKEYDYTGAEGYYTKGDTKFMSNVENQYLRYWDLSAPTTTFYAYAPYINGTGKATYDNSTKKLTIPNGSIVAAYNTPTESEYMYAVTQVAAADYGKDVPLKFNRLNAKVNIKFWEDIDGYSVRILDLKGDTYKGVQAVPAKRTGTAPSYTYAKDEYIEKSGVVIDFTTVTSPSVAWDASATTTQDPLKFDAPTAAEIGTTRLLASSSATTYYAIPKAKESGFTFHVTYELTSTTGEKIVVKNATVFVPEDVCDWKANTHYTYIFKITKGSNGTTTTDPAIDPKDPNVPVEPSLYPIVFDNCTIVDWEESESDHIITDGTDPVYYSVSLDKQEVKAAAGGTVTATLKEQGTTVASPAGTYTVSGPDATKVTCSTAGVVTVQTGAKTGVYTVTYTETASGNHPGTYTATFYVVGAYAITTSTSEIGTGGNDATTFTVSATETGGAVIPASEALAIVYPAGLTGDQKNKVHFINATTVKVEKDAVPGAYQVAYTTDEGTAYADFTVANYGLSLSTNAVGLSQADQDVTITAGGGSESTVTLAGPASFADVELATGGSKVTVKPTATTGTYTVTNTVTKNGSTTVYTQTFVVKDVYTLSLDKSLVDNDEETTITATAKKNGAAVTSGITVSGPDATYVSISGATITVKVGAATGTYTVEYAGEKKTFIVQD